MILEIHTPPTHDYRCIFTGRQRKPPMFLVLFALFMVLPWALSGNVSTRPDLKIFRDEYKSVTAACVDLGFTKKASGSDTGNLSHLAEEFLSLRALIPTSV